MATSNKSLTFKGEALKVSGTEVHVGDTAPNIKLVGGDMGDVELSKFAGKVMILSIVPSLDTPVCAVQTKRFNAEIDKLGGRAVGVTVSRDLPFAQKRWCGQEGVESVVCLSDYKYRTAGSAYGTEIDSWGLLARAVFVIAPNGKIAHVEYVDDVSTEPNYTTILDKVSEVVNS